MLQGNIEYARLEFYTNPNSLSERRVARRVEGAWSLQSVIQVR
jgi:hypothetical protein